MKKTFLIITILFGAVVNAFAFNPVKVEEKDDCVYYYDSESNKKYYSYNKFDSMEDIVRIMSNDIKVSGSSISSSADICTKSYEESKELIEWSLSTGSKNIIYLSEMTTILGDSFISRIFIDYISEDGYVITTTWSVYQK